jgi:hypothetical protein
MDEAFAKQRTRLENVQFINSFFERSLYWGKTVTNVYWVFCVKSWRDAFSKELIFHNDKQASRATKDVRGNIYISRFCVGCVLSLLEKWSDALHRKNIACSVI